MATLEQSFFKNRKMNAQRLLSYGFSKTDNGYSYTTAILDGQFDMTVDISKTEDVSTKVVDSASNEEYVLHRASGACGAFVGMVKEAYENLLYDIFEHCFEPDVFKSDQAKQIIQYVWDTYGDELEFLWQRFPDNAIWRRKDTGKWYAALLTVSKSKLGIDSDEKVEILDLRISSEDIKTVIDHKRFFPGYHMNKKHWYTVCLDGTVGSEEINRRIDNSYQLAAK